MSGAPAGARAGWLGWLFATVLTVELLFFSGTVRSWDGGTMLSVTRSVALQGTWAVPVGALGRTGRDGRLYAQYGPACSVAALPLFLVGHGLARAARLGPERTVQIEEAAVALFNPLVVALTAVVLALAALALGVGPRWAVGGGLLGAFGTGLFVQMKDFNSEPLTALLFLGAVYVLLRQRGRVTGGGLALGGALAGAAILARPANALGAAILGIAGLVAAAEPHPLPPPLAGEGVAEGNSEGSDREGMAWNSGAGRAACLLAPLLVGVGLYAWYNWARFGHPLDTGYLPVTFDYPLLRGAWLQLVSAERGLIWYDPLVLLAPAGLALLWRRGERGVAALIGALAVGYVLLYSLYAQSPIGGHSMGQRFLLIVVPLLVLAGLPVVERVCAGTRNTGETPVPPGAGETSVPPGARAGPGARRVVLAIIVVSVLVQVPLVWVNPSYYYARLGAEPQPAGAGARLEAAVLVRAWPLAVEVTRDALTRPGWVRSLQEHGHGQTSAEEMLPGPRSFHVPYCWWALAWAYGVPGKGVLVAVLANLLLAAYCAGRLCRSVSLAVEENAP